jgi:hypothetical protein
MKFFWSAGLGIVATAGLLFWARNPIHARGEWPQSTAVGGPIAAAATPPTAAVQRSSLRPDLAIIEALRHDFARLGTLGIEAKGEADELLCQLRAQLGPRNAAEVVCTLPRDELASPFGMAAIEAWLQADVDGASEWVAGQPARTDSHAWLVAHALIQHPNLLDRFCDRLDSDPWSEAFLDYAAREILRSNPIAAAAIADSLRPGERRRGLVETIAFDWMDQDPIAASAWIIAGRDRSLRDHLVTIGAQSYASANPLDALEWLLAHSEGRSVPPQTLGTILDIWRHTAPAQAVAFEVLLSPAGTRDPLSSLR